ncbi:bifunctional ADP-dependent NAD(P)H-hydrate dehydratase/NAD(P)H-hydrate epimerase [Pengzhenrongella sicca]|uniref:Bifunctional NAD(P)H-hydrate repair enzyme n=1 Tax=Pengzhenrongella sicca TaxID=2819238 RepID=A0A8A4ZD79_9MICO|nr:bifunctional ADP-dependent NAD(P)H-hydrate dehydratase/NAD(P)H-hydrate epimerase [Pengzhenrongella sicca]QTE29902.1 bifunctional ADP-dependent (S)-NAD(P)H-hydrate dehydratase/NAD(P)H-hydrate epimerase [Pengzhenrongella sicca]
MILGYSAAQVRAAEASLLAAGPPAELMERAAFALAVRVARELRQRRGRVAGAGVLVLVGPGNNGGDALFAGAELARRGVRVLAVLTSSSVHDAGLAALRAAGGRVVRAVDDLPDGAVPVDDLPDGAVPDDDVPDFALPDGAATGPRWVGPVLAGVESADVVLDGLLGIGARGPVRGVAAEVVALVAGLVDAANAEPGRPLVVAVDTPSGIDVDDGALPGPAAAPDPVALFGPGVLPADLTVTFGAAKAGLLLPPASGVVGMIDVVDLGLDLAGVVPVVARLERSDVAGLWPVPGSSSHKYDRGVLGVVAGTPRYPGAAVLTVTAAVRAGVGMVRYVGPPGVTATVVAARPEVVAGYGRVQAWVVGPGVDPLDPPQAAHVRDALVAAHAARLPVVVDAGALDLLPDRVDPWVVLTPHAGELARLLAERGEIVERGDVEAHPLTWARRAHALTGATVLLKGATTVVVGAGGAAYSQQDAPAWLATAGAGDVLAGLLGALLAGRSDEVVADPTLAVALAAAAASVHGLAAGRARPGGPVAALDVADALPATIAALLAVGDWRA